MEPEGEAPEPMGRRLTGRPAAGNTPEAVARLGPGWVDIPGRNGFPSKEHISRG